MSDKKKIVVDKFTQLFGQPECIVKSPGRANIIGEHVDYCGGLVLPFAIDQSMYFCLRSNHSNNINFHSVDFCETYVIKDGEVNDEKQWCRYLNGLVRILKQRGIEINGLDIAFGSEIPIGGGVSSSSALCCGLILLLNKKYKLKLSISESVELAASIEHGIGLKGGKMDQTSILLGKKNHAILLDCESLDYAYIEIDLNSHFFMLFDTQVKHSLVNTKYNKRREQVEHALEMVKEKYGKECTFRNTTLEQIVFLKDTNPIEYKRIFHVLNEISRVGEAIDFIEWKYFENLGLLMNDSHASLAGDYEVSCDELNFLAENLQSLDQVLGARMMGGGFGGNVIALMSEELSPDTIQKMKDQYRIRFGFDFRTMRISPSDGVRVV